MENNEQPVIPVPDELIEKMKKYQHDWEQQMLVSPEALRKCMVDNAKKLIEFDSQCIKADIEGDPHRFDGFARVIESDVRGVTAMNPIPSIFGSIKDKKIQLSEDAKKHWEEYLKGVWPKEDDESKTDDITKIAMAILRGEEIPNRKKVRIEVELEYPSCDIYPTREIMEFLEESLQEYLNANLSDGDDRLKMTHISVTSEGITMTKK